MENNGQHLSFIVVFTRSFVCVTRSARGDYLCFGSWVLVTFVFATFVFGSWLLHYFCYVCFHLVVTTFTCFGRAVTTFVFDSWASFASASDLLLACGCYVFFRLVVTMFVFGSWFLYSFLLLRLFSARVNTF